MKRFNIIYVIILPLVILGQSVYSSKLDSLIKSLGNENGEARESAEASLVKAGESAERSLVRALRSKDPIVRRHAGYALAQMGNPAAINSLLETMTGDDKREAAKAAKLMARIRSEETIPILIDMLMDENPHFQRRSKQGLLAIGEPAVDPLIKLLKNRDPNIRSSAIEVLGSIGDKRVVPYLIEILEKDRAARIYAATALGQMGDTIVVPELIEALKEKDPSMRKASAMALGNIGDLRAIEPLIGLFLDDDRSVPLYAVNALGMIGEKVFDKVNHLLKNENYNLRLYATMTLGEIRDKRAIHPLLSIIENKKDELELRRAAIIALGSVGGEKVVDYLIKFLGYDELSKAASRELIKIGEPAIIPLIAMLNSQNPIVLNNVKEALIAIGKPAVPHLIVALDHYEPVIRKNSINILSVTANKEIIPFIIKKLKDPSESVRIAAATALGKLGDESVVIPLLNIVNSQSGLLRLEAVRSIGLIGKNAGEKAVDILLNVVRSETGEIQRETISALGKIGSNKATPILLGLLGKANLEITSALIDALGEIGDERAIKPLVNLLSHAHPDIRRATIFALGQIGSVDAVNPILITLSDSSKNVRLASVQTLSSRAELLDKGAVEPLLGALVESDTYQQRIITYILVKIGENAIEPLIGRLNDNNSEIRMYAARALGSIRNPKGVKPLLSALDDSVPEVRAAAAAALGEIRAEEAVEPLIKHLAEDAKQVRLSTAWALGAIGDARAAMPLNIALNDEDLRVREAAVSAIGKLTSQSCPLVTNLTRFDLVSLVWTILLGLAIFFPLLGRKIRPLDRLLLGIASKFSFPTKAKWWIMLFLGLGALALFIWCYICKDESGTAAFAVTKPGFLPTLYLYSFRIFPFFIGGCILSGFILRYFSAHRHLPRSMFGATTLGAVTPLCSCAVIPMARGMLATRVPVRAAIAFLVSTPILSPFIIMMSYGVIGLKFTIVRIVSVFVMAMVIGIFIEKVVGREELDKDADFQNLCKGCVRAGTAHGSGDSVLLTAWNQIGYLLKYMVLGIFLGALLETYLPASWVAKYMSSNFLGLLAATTVGLPLYLCSGQEVLLLKPLLDMGLPLGHAIAFTISTNGICLTSIALLTGAIGRKTTFWLTLLFWSGSLVLGFLINIFFI